MDQILLVEDSQFFGNVVCNALQAHFTYKVVWAKTYGEARKLLEKDKFGFMAGLIDLNLPDAEIGAAVDLSIAYGIPTIVFTGNLNDDIRDQIISKRIVDYVLKEGRYNIDYIVSLVRRLKLNRSIKVLVIDDSTVSRKKLVSLLEIYQYQIYQAKDGVEAMAVFKKHPDIRLVITDYHMPNMNGFEFTREIRKSYSIGDLAIIGISSVGHNILSAQFIKSGANDFIHKPFLNEEFLCRVTHNVEMIEHVQLVKKLSNIDFLTELVNRRHFFEIGNRLYKASQRKRSPLAVAMIDIDDFKSINDRYGHDAGDAAIRQIAQMLSDRFRESDVVSRFGGEEYCILTVDMDVGHVFKVYDQLRESISRAELVIGEVTLRITVSIGICSKLQQSLEAMISVADKMLYKAKESGKNKVVWDQSN